MTAEARPVPERPAPGTSDPAVVVTPMVTVRVWQLPVRVIHWTIFFSVALLSVTGIYIAKPFIGASSNTAYLMGTVRTIHLIAAWVFSIAIVSRVIWAFIGNRWARWDQFVPVGEDRARQIWPMLKYYLFIQRDPPPAVGHNPLAGLTYLMVFAMFSVQIVTGLAMVGLASPGGWLSWWTGWVFDLFGIPVVRLIHHLIMWLTIGFIIHHVYSASLIDVEERSGLISSIVTGYKRFPADRL